MSRLPLDFNSKIYIDCNNLVELGISSTQDAIDHYLKSDYKSQPPCTIYDVLPKDFDWKSYLNLNPDIAKKHSSRHQACYHYYNYGKSEKRRYKKALVPDDFDWKEYLNLNPDVAKDHNTEELATLHYSVYGEADNRPYQAPIVPDDFDWKEYLSLNPDISETHNTEELATLHYRIYGEADSRPYRASSIPDDFDWKEYLRFNPDIIKDINSKELATLHYIRHGEADGRIYQASGIPDNFDYRIYILLNPDLQNLIEDYPDHARELASKHYIQVGIEEDRNYSCGNYSYEDILSLKKNQKKLNLPFSQIFINHNSSLTGAPITLVDRVNILASQGHKNIVFVDCLPNDLYNIDSRVKVLYHYNDFNLLLEILKNNNPIYIFCNSKIDFLLSKIEYLGDLSKKIIWFFHEYFDGYIDTYGNTNCFSFLQKNIFSTLFLSKSLRDSFGFSEFNSSIHGEVIDSLRLSYIDKNIKPRKKNSRPLIGMSGSLCDRKNHKLFVEVSTLLPEYDFIWVGGKIKHKSDNFSSVPSTSNPYMHYNKFDYFFLTSEQDPCPLVLLETLYMNKKVILLDGNIAHEHDYSKLENCHILKGHKNNAKIISKKLKSLKLDSKPNKTNVNREYVQNNFIEFKPFFAKQKSIDHILCFSFYVDGAFNDLDYYCSLFNFVLFSNPNISQIYIALSSDSTKKSEQVKSYFSKNINFDRINFILRPNKGWDLGGLVSIIKEIDISPDQYVTYFHNKSNKVWRDSLYNIFYLRPTSIYKFDTICDRKALHPCNLQDINRKRFLDYSFTKNLANISFDYVSGSCFITKSQNLKLIQDNIKIIESNLTDIDTDDKFWVNYMKEVNYPEIFNAYARDPKLNSIDVNSQDYMSKHDVKNFFDLFQNHGHKGIPDACFEHALERYIGYLITQDKDVFLCD